jgi:hypothetical protein
MSVFTKFKSAVVSEDWLLAETILNETPNLAGQLDKHGSSMLHYAVLDQNIQRAAWLMQHGWPFEHALLALFRSGSEGTPGIAKSLCDSLDSASTMPISCGKTFLELAIAERALSWVEYVFRRGWLCTHEEWVSAGVAAIKYFDPDVLAKILECPVLPSAAIVEMGSESISRNRMHAFGLLIEAGLAVDSVDSNGFSLLTRAATMGRIDCAKSLLDLGAGIDRFDANSKSALYLAVSSGREDMVELLLKRGAMPDKRQGVNGQGDSPARLATKSSAGKVRQMFAPMLEHAVLSSVQVIAAPKVVAKRL